MAETARLLVERGKPHRFVISVCMGYIEVCNKTEVHENSRFLRTFKSSAFAQKLLAYASTIYFCISGVYTIVR